MAVKNFIFVEFTKHHLYIFQTDVFLSWPFSDTLWPSAKSTPHVLTELVEYFI